VDSFDADVLIYAATNHRLGPKVRNLVESGESPIGSVLLLPELLSKPMRRGAAVELEDLSDLLARITLLPCDETIAKLATSLRASHGLATVDAVHLATAVNAGADRFITNNKRDFPLAIEEIEVIYPDQL
jgi:predicted nucleic acid-binding protein